MGFVIALLFFDLALSARWSDSELWSLGLSKVLFHSSQPSVDYKWAFNFVLNSVYRFELGNLQTVLSARIIFALLGLGVVAGVYVISLTISQSKRVAVWCSLFFLSSWLFLSQGYRIRSDLVACFFQVSALAFYLWGRKRISSYFFVPLFVLLSLGILLATPKGLYHLLVNLVYIYISERNQRRSAGSQAVKWGILGCLLLFAAFLFTKGPQFRTAFDYFVGSFSANSHRPSYLSVAAFRYVFETLKWQSVGIVSLLLAAAVSMKYRTSFRSPALAGAAVTALILILFHNDRLPFFIFSLMPIPMIYGGLYMATAWRSFSGPKGWKGAIGVLVPVMILGQGLIGAHYIKSEQNNELQIQVQRYMQDYVGRHPGKLFYDATIVLPRDNQVYVFPAPGHAGNREEVLGILDRPEMSLIFFGNRLYEYVQDFYLSLEERFFIQIGHGVFARSYVMRSSSPLTSERWREICQRAGASHLYAYEGPGFLNMRILNEARPHSCTQGAPEVSSAEEFLAFTPYEPFVIPDSLSFAQVFDAGL